MEIKLKSFTEGIMYKFTNLHFEGYAHLFLFEKRFTRYVKTWKKRLVQFLFHVDFNNKKTIKITFGQSIIGQEQ